MTNSIPEIEDADCLFVIGSNTSEAHPLVAHRIFRAIEKGAKLIVVDPRKTQVAELADIHASLKFGTDVAFLNGVMNEIVTNNWHNSQFVADRTEGFEAFNRTIRNYPADKASAICGISADVIREIARLYATAGTSSILYTLGITEHSHGVDNVKSLANLAMLTGQIGKPSSGVNPLRGQNNVQGACDMGALPNVYPGYQVVTNLDVRIKFEEAWGARLSPEVGITIPENDGQAFRRFHQGDVHLRRKFRGERSQHASRHGRASGCRVSGGPGHISHRDGPTGRCGAAGGLLGRGRRHLCEHRAEVFSGFARRWNRRARPDPTGRSFATSAPVWGLA